MKYKIVSYMRVDADEPVVYDTIIEAIKAATQMDLMQPEDIHRIEEVKNNRKET